MNTKLTLRLDEALVRRAKVYARKSGRSVSRLVADYFSLLDGPEATGAVERTPIVSALRGTIRGAAVDENEYRRHLEEKHL